MVISDEIRNKNRRDVQWAFDSVAPVKVRNPIWHGLFCPVYDVVIDTVLQNVLDKIAEDLL